MYVCVAENAESLVFFTFFVFFFCVLHNFQIFHVRLGKKSKSLGFSRVYICVKAKLTLVSFFLLFFYEPFPNETQTHILTNMAPPCTVDNIAKVS